ncbi:MAG: hypothetical protein JWR35_3881 [Marmoricola sp.]|nr:hypothetical protein [Marmoricola sp.]
MIRGEATTLEPSGFMDRTTRRWNWAEEEEKEAEELREGIWGDYENKQYREIGEMERK